ncbi:hypothetical protein BpHYR1_000209, partial [Brachionus plicatilis]
KHNKERQIYHPAKAIKVKTVFERIAIYLIWGLPETPEGFKGILLITEPLTRKAWAYCILTLNNVNDTLEKYQKRQKSIILRNFTNQFKN